MNDNYIKKIDVVGFAYQIINMDKENERLKFELEHYKEMHRINSKSIQKSIDSSHETIGMVLSACLDPESSINKLKG